MRTGRCARHRHRTAWITRRRPIGRGDRRVAGVNRKDTRETVTAISLRETTSPLYLFTGALRSDEQAPVLHLGLSSIHLLQCTAFPAQPATSHAVPRHKHSQQRVYGRDRLAMRDTHNARRKARRAASDPTRTANLMTDLPNLLSACAEPADERPLPGREQPIESRSEWAKSAASAPMANQGRPTAASVRAASCRGTRPKPGCALATSGTCAARASYRAAWPMTSADAPQSLRQ